MGRVGSGSLWLYFKKDRVRVIEEVFGRPLFVDPLRFSILFSSTKTGTVVVDVLHKLAI